MQYEIDDNVYLELPEGASVLEMLSVVLVSALGGAILATSGCVWLLNKALRKDS
jgi:hypothetical protein